MSELTQDQRLISISSPLAKDELVLLSFEGTEQISDLFNFQIEVLSKNHSIKPEELIGKELTISVQDKQKRTFHGYISRFAFGEIQTGNLRSYRMEMVPWLWFLSKTNNFRIFQEKSAKDIVSQIFADLGFNDYEFSLSTQPASREYCIQHNESDLNFISRLLEEEGIAYYFEQKKGSHVMRIVDAANAYKECKETGFTYSKEKGLNEKIILWEHLYEFRKGKWSSNDYDFKMPAKTQIQTTDSTSKFPNVKNYEHYEYGATHDFNGLKDLSTKRIEAEEVPMNVIQSTSYCSSFYAGGKFKLSSHFFPEEQGSYIITSIKHRAVDNTHFSGSKGGSEYANEFHCIPDSVHFRPPLKHKKPRVYGPQSAIVVGPSGEEIHVDEHGRIKVQFHWDREGKSDEMSSCWIRVMQPWAGPGWGTSFIPRIGMEVVVNFYNGDPDRPIVTGSVYNGENQPPFSLPSSKTQSGIKTRSTKEGTKENCNELRFEDKKGDEQLFIQAEKNLDVNVKNDQSLTVNNDRTKSVTNNETSSIGKNRDKNVGENQSESIGKDKSIDVGSNHTESIGKNKTLDVGANHTESIKGDMVLTVDKNLEETISKDVTINIGGDSTSSIGKNLSSDIGKALALVAGDQIVLKTGSASITMKKDGTITIKGKDITLKGSGKINVKASSAVAIKGSKVTNN